MTAVLSIPELRALQRKKRSKYGNKRVTVDGVKFDSKAEAARDAELVLLASVGAITGLTRQPRFDLIVNGNKVCAYVGDWRYQEHGQDVVEDRKGVLTPAFKIKWALAKALHPDIEWRLS